MKVSVIIPTYNRERYICQAIDSVLRQTFEDSEVIVVDDGSTDNTKEIIEPFLGKIKYIYTDNHGPAHARNIGMQAAGGEYIAFLDSDDLYYPYKLELQSNFLDRHTDIGMVCTEFSAIDANGIWDEFHLKKYHKFEHEKLAYNNIYQEEILIEGSGLNCREWAKRKIYLGNIFDAYYHNICLATNTIMFRRDILKSCGLQNERYWLFEEYEFALRITRHNRIAFIDVPTYKIRYHENQISGTNRKRAMQILIKKQENMLKIAEQHGLNDKQYYLQNKDAVDKRLSILRKALAVPLMVRGKDNKRARKLLSECALYGHPEHFLWLITFTPYLVRRIVVKILFILKVL